MIVRNIIKSNKGSFNSNDTIYYSVEEFRNKNLKSAPVLENGNIIGLLELKDILNYVLLGEDLSFTVNKIMNSKPCITGIDTSLDKLINIKFDTWLVVNESGDLAGVIYKEDVMLVNLNSKKFANDSKLYQDVNLLNPKLNLHFNRIIKEMLDSMDDGVYITDSSGVTMFVNNAYTKLSGLEKKDVIGIHMDKLIDKGYFLESASLMALKEKKPISLIDCFRNGKKCLVTSSPVIDENGEIIMVVTNLRDMTNLLDLKSKLEETKGSNEIYRLELKELRKTQADKYNIVGNSKNIIKIFEMIDRISEVDATVLLLGETGVGKEVIAREIYKNSLRKDKPFIKINCASIPENLFESELFGYVEGAFTGATSKGKPGLFELADGGTILLDEIGELTVEMQSKLLRVLQEKKVVRVGDIKEKKIDVRIIAATNRNLELEIEKGNFREDLFYRLNVIPIIVPPLRDRREDIPLLALHFLDEFNNKYNKNKRLNYLAYELLEWYSWPGNVRQLKNLVERLILTCPYDTIEDDHILEIVGKKEIGELYDLSSGESTLDEAVIAVEKQLIFKALKKHGTTRKAAKVLGISQSTVVRKANKYNIEVESWCNKGYAGDANMHLS